MIRNQKKVSGQRIMMRKSLHLPDMSGRSIATGATIMSNLDGGVDVIYFRYADVLLMHAEALLETKGLPLLLKIFGIINQLRDRCGGGRVTAANYTSEDALRTLVRNERRVIGK